MAQDTVPVVDLSCFEDGGSMEDQAQVAKMLFDACSQIGFFYVKGHGCPKTVRHDAFRASMQMFDSSEKVSLDAKNSPLYRGYNGIQTGGHSCTPEEKGALPDLKESFTIGAECLTKDKSSPMHGPNQWPTTLPEFEPAMRLYWETLIGTVAVRIMKALAMSLNQEVDFFLKQCDNPVAQMVLLRYPGTEEDQRRGCGAHTDCGFLTILAQDAVEGLEVQRTDGTWISAPPIEDTFIVNLGDMAAQWTNDVYQSTPHRVSSNTETRHSIPFFLNCNFECQVEALEGCGEPKYPPTQAGSYILQKLGLMYLL